jgi:hypothetical protein
MRDDDKRDLGRTGTSTLEAEREHDLGTAEPDAHAVGTGVGAAGGAATGAALGAAVGGPPGALIGAAVGGVLGGFAGRGIAEAVNPVSEDAFWRDNYHWRPYAAGRRYEELAPAYKYGWESRMEHADRPWSQAEPDLACGWGKARGESGLEWHEAKAAAEDAWNRVTLNVAEDNYWRENHASRPYAKGRKYEEIQPAYRYGREARERHAGRRFEEVEADLRNGWERAKDPTGAAWDNARDAVKDAFGRDPGADRLR